MFLVDMSTYFLPEDGWIPAAGSVILLFQTMSYIQILKPTYCYLQPSLISTIIPILQ